MSEILSHAEIKALLERNNANPELGRPVYVPWTDNKRKALTQSQFDEMQRKANLNGKDYDLKTWMRRLNSKRFRLNRTDYDTNKCRVVTRPVQLVSNGTRTWTEVELNARLR